MLKHPAWVEQVVVAVRLHTYWNAKRISAELRRHEIAEVGHSWVSQLLSDLGAHRPSGPRERGPDGIGKQDRVLVDQASRHLTEQQDLLTRLAAKHGELQKVLTDDVLRTGKIALPPVDLNTDDRPSSHREWIRHGSQRLPGSR